MEGSERRRRQYEQSSFPRSQMPAGRVRLDPNTTGIQHVAGAQGLESSDRFRQAQLMSSQPPTSTTMSVSTNAQDMTNFGPFAAPQHYASPQMQGQGTPFQYQPEFAQDPQRQQPYPQHYTSQLMYGVSQQQGPHQTPYDPVAQYQPRPSVPTETLPHQYSDSQYFNTGTAGGTSTPAAVPPQYPTAPYQQPVQFTPQTELDRPTAVPHYPSTEPGLTQPAAPEPTDLQQRQSDRYEGFYNQYRRALRDTNENASRGRLIEAGESLLEISSWLLGNAEGLELTKDNQAIHGDRLKLWKDFNYCWLAFLTRQLDDSKTMRASRQRPAPGQSVLQKSTLQHLGDELTRLCDGLEKSGLVDYEMGVWEEEIVHLLLQCREIASAGNDDPVTARVSRG